MKKVQYRLILISIIVFLFSSFISIASPDTFVIGDNTCSIEDGETRHNSPNDCKITFDGYIECIKEKEDCQSEYVWKELHYFLGIIILILLYLQNQKKSKPKATGKKRKRKNYISNYNDNSRKESILRFRGR